MGRRGRAEKLGIYLIEAFLVIYLRHPNAACLSSQRLRQLFVSGHSDSEGCVSLAGVRALISRSFMQAQF
jgi:hypothetical protein